MSYMIKQLVVCMTDLEIASICSILNTMSHFRREKWHKYVTKRHKKFDT